jgi:hypothetical protein
MELLIIIVLKCYNITKTWSMSIKLGVSDGFYKEMSVFPCCYWSRALFFLEVSLLGTNVVGQSALLHMDGKKTTQSLIERSTLA